MGNILRRTYERDIVLPHFIMVLRLQYQIVQWRWVVIRKTRVYSCNRAFANLVLRMVYNLYLNRMTNTY